MLLPFLGDVRTGEDKIAPLGERWQRIAER